MEKLEEPEELFIFLWLMMVTLMLLRIMVFLLLPMDKTKPTAKEIKENPFLYPGMMTPELYEH